MSILDDVYARAKRGSNFFMHIPHSVVTLSCVAVRHNLGIEVAPVRMEKILYEEGLLPASEYKIPYWYVKKYLTKDHQAISAKARHAQLQTS